ncbi:hypothetical protein ABZ722_25810 [Streptomyces longwoodensis]|uniref:hypothetical protein n=1 Tax=Streptomyces longwoodensis TaxID=68231 RepID=UPI00340A6ADB
MSYARLGAKLERNDAYRNARRPDAATRPAPRAATGRRPTQGVSLERSFPPVLFVLASAPCRAAPATRQATFHQHAHTVNYRIIAATTTLAQLTRQGPDEPVWLVADRGAGEERYALDALMKAW